MINIHIKIAINLAKYGFFNHAAERIASARYYESLTHSNILTAIYRAELDTLINEALQALESNDGLETRIDICRGAIWISECSYVKIPTETIDKLADACVEKPLKIHKPWWLLLFTSKKKRRDWHQKRQALIKDEGYSFLRRESVRAAYFFKAIH